MGFSNLHSYKSYIKILRSLEWSGEETLYKKESLRQLNSSHHQLNWDKIIAKYICTYRNLDPHIINSSEMPSESYLSLVCSSYFKNSEIMTSYFCNDIIHF